MSHKSCPPLIPGSHRMNTINLNLAQVPEPQAGLVELCQLLHRIGFSGSPLRPWRRGFVQPMCAGDCVSPRLSGNGEERIVSSFQTFFKYTQNVSKCHDWLDVLLAILVVCILFVHDLYTRWFEDGTFSSPCQTRFIARDGLPTIWSTPISACHQQVRPMFGWLDSATTYLAESSHTDRDFRCFLMSVFFEPSCDLLFFRSTQPHVFSARSMGWVLAEEEAKKERNLSFWVRPLQKWGVVGTK